MHWVVENNLNKIVTEEAGGMLNNYCDLYRIEGKSSRIFENVYRTINWKIGWKLCSLNIDKLIFHIFPNISS